MISSRPSSSALSPNHQRGSTADWKTLGASFLSGPSFTAAPSRPGQPEAAAPTATVKTALASVSQMGTSTSAGADATAMAVPPAAGRGGAIASQNVYVAGTETAPSPWTRHFSARTGSSFWYNHQTGTSTWMCPNQESGGKKGGRWLSWDFTCVCVCVCVC
jgi:hypothetical protein